MKRRWPLLLAVPALAALQLTFLRMEDRGSPDIVEASNAPTYTVDDAKLARYDSDGDLALRGHADHVEYYDDRSAQAAGLSLETLNDGKTGWHLVSPTASMPAGQDRYLLEGPVVVTGNWPDTGEPVRVDSTQVWVDPDIHQFFSATPVTIQGQTRQGSAVGMRADWDSHRLLLQRDVKMTYVAAHS